MKTKYATASVIMSLIASGMALGALPIYRGRGKGEGCQGNKHAKSSFKQNQRRGL
jgi:hypothetical protein